MTGIFVEEKHFDPEETQILFRLFIKDKGYKVGDVIRPFSFRLWLMPIANRYRKEFNIDELSPVTSLGDNEWIEYVRKYVEGKQ